MANISGKRHVRTSIIAGLQNNALIAPLVLKGYCDTDVVYIAVPIIIEPFYCRGYSRISPTIRY
jgi:hypothetical protein